MKFTIITPVLNGERYIGETISSVISQRGDFALEYIIVDGGSSDRTPNIVSSFQKLLESGIYPALCREVKLSFVSQKDEGMYDAINRGFSSATGDVFAWINADDIYLPGAFALMQRVFSTFSEVLWVKGITSYINKHSHIHQLGGCFLYNQDWLRKGLYGRDLYFVQQDSTFWRAVLWEKAGTIDKGLQYAGDYWLWTRFAREAPLVSLNAYISCFRKAEGQLSSRSESYRHEVERVSPSRDKASTLAVRYFTLERHLPLSVKKLTYRLLLGDHVYSLISEDALANLSKDQGSFYDLRQKIGRSWPNIPFCI